MANKCSDQSCIWCNMETEQLLEAVRQANQDWTIKATEWISKLPYGAVFTAEDMLEAVGETHSAGVSGGVIQAAHKTKVIAPVGYTQAQRKSSHSRVLRKWLKVV